MIKIPKFVASAYEIAPVGRHLATVSAIVDVGTQVSIYAARRTVSPKVQLTFELPNLRHSRTGKPLKVTQLSTLSMHPKANLRKNIEGWMGKGMTDEEANAFEFSWMLGRYCQLDVSHSVKDNNVYASVARILPVSEGTVLPEAANDPVFFSLGAPDLRVFASFSTGMQALIQASPEWRKLPFANNWVAHYEAHHVTNEPAF